MKKSFLLHIGWLYPDLMSTYGDRGNIIILTKRCEWRGIQTKIIQIDFAATNHDIEKCDMIFGGGAQDRQQGLLIDDLKKNKGSFLKRMINSGIPGLFVCGSPQLLGRYFINGKREKIEGLGIFDMISKYPEQKKPRCIGNLIAKINAEFKINSSEFHNTIVGFENHGGRTYLGKSANPFAKVVYGNGNNGEDDSEGAVYRNCIATYSHGPFLPKNPHIADWLIQKALELKYKKHIVLLPLNDDLEWQAHTFILQKYKVNSN